MGSSDCQPWDERKRSNGNCVLERIRNKKQSIRIGCGDDIPADTGSWTVGRASRCPLEFLFGVCEEGGSWRAQISWDVLCLEVLQRSS